MISAFNQVKLAIRQVKLATFAQLFLKNYLKLIQYLKKKFFKSHPLCVSVWKVWKHGILSGCIPNTCKLLRQRWENAWLDFFELCSQEPTLFTK